MSEYAFLNGEFLPNGEAKVSTFRVRFRPGLTESPPSG